MAPLTEDVLPPQSKIPIYEDYKYYNRVLDVESISVLDCLAPVHRFAYRKGLQADITFGILYYVHVMTGDGRYGQQLYQVYKYIARESEMFGAEFYETIASHIADYLYVEPTENKDIIIKIQKNITSTFRTFRDMSSGN